MQDKTEIDKNGIVNESFLLETLNDENVTLELIDVMFCLDRDGECGMCKPDASNIHLSVQGRWVGGVIGDWITNNRRNTVNIVGEGNFGVEPECKKIVKLYSRKSKI